MSGRKQRESLSGMKAKEWSESNVAKVLSALRLGARRLRSHLPLKCCRHQGRQLHRLLALGLNVLRTEATLLPDHSVAFVPVHDS